MIKKIIDKEEWDRLATNAGASFLQSFEWGEILKSLGQEVERVVAENSGQIALSQIVYKRIPLGMRYVQIHKGPAVSGNGALALDELMEYWREKGCVFARLEPANLNFFSQKVYHQLKLIRDINPPATFVLDLRRDLDDILKSFHHKTRYNINLASRKNLTVSHEKNFESFWNLFVKTGERDNFLLHPKKTYAAAIASPAVQQITIYNGKIPLASVCIFSFNKIAYYLYGASDHEYRQLMAPYLAQWEAIKWAKESGHMIYDFFGVAPNVSKATGHYEYDSRHRYAGVSRFKVGFNAQYREEPGTFDLPLRPAVYYLYQLIRKVLSSRAK